MRRRFGRANQRVADCTNVCVSGTSAPGRRTCVVSQRVSGPNADLAVVAADEVHTDLSAAEDGGIPKDAPSQSLSQSIAVPTVLVVRSGLHERP